MILDPLLERLRRVDPLRLDAALAIVLTVGALLGLWLTPASSGGRTPDLLANAVVVAMNLPLAFRRRRPVLVLSIIGGATILSALTGPSGIIGVGVLFALYSVAVYASRRESFAALGWTLLGIFISLVAAFANTAPTLPVVVFVTQLASAWLLFGVAWLLGDLVRSRSDAVELLQQRNAELLVEREENARLAVVDERARIARELHDAVAHSVSVMVVQAGAARRGLETAAQEADGSIPADRIGAIHGALDAIETTGRRTLGEMRRVVGALRPTGDEAYEPQPSLAGIETLLSSVRRAGLPVELLVEGEAQPLPPGIDVSAYRVVQEALTNTLKHAHAGTARVRLHYEPDALEVEVTDDGRGAAASLLEPPHRGYGLVGMRERVAVAGGELVAEPRKSGGFIVRARLPLGQAS